MKELVGKALGSKKFVAMLVGIAAEFAAVKLGLPEEQLAGLMTDIAAIVSAYCVGQGVADHGKEKALVEAEAAASAK